MKKPVILCVDDELEVLESLKIELKSTLSDECIVETAASGREALELVAKIHTEQRAIAVAIVDYAMPGMAGDELLKQLHACLPDTLNILLSGCATMEILAGMLQQTSLYRYIAKPWNPAELQATTASALTVYLQKQQLAEGYRSVFENAFIGIFQSSPEGRYLNVNPALAKIFGYGSPEDLMTAVTDIRTQLYVLPERRRLFIEHIHQYGEVADFESQVYRKDGSIIWISENANAIADEHGNQYYQGFVEDITQKKLADAERDRLNLAYERFVPDQFLQLLDKPSIVNVELGDCVQKNMSILFCDIRNFTAISETMSPGDNFHFLNAFLSRMEPVIIGHGGFVDKYLGDGIMSLFAGGADSAVLAALSMLNRLTAYNESRQRPGRMPIEVGIAINSGTIVLGTVGSKQRMDSTAIGSAVNLAARLQGLLKTYGVTLIVSEHTFGQMENFSEYSFRFLDRVVVRGKSEPVAVYEIFDADPPELCEAKFATKDAFEQAVLLFHEGKHREAKELFQSCLEQYPNDRAVQAYVYRCIELPRSVVQL